VAAAVVEQLPIPVSVAVQVDLVVVVVVVVEPRAAQADLAEAAVVGRAVLADLAASAAAVKVVGRHPVAAQAL
jgi:hypothetical protein